MPRFSLIVPTAGRTTELAELLASIVAQNRNDLELIVVDQNDDDRVVPLLETLPSTIAVLHLRQKQKSPPMARNTGLDAASGEVIAFPDDDCWYPVDLLNRIDNWFKTNAQYTVLAVGALDDEGYRVATVDAGCVRHQPAQRVEDHILPPALFVAALQAEPVPCASTRGSLAERRQISSYDCWQPASRPLRPRAVYPSPPARHAERHCLARAREGRRRHGRRSTPPLACFAVVWPAYLRPRSCAAGFGTGTICPRRFLSCPCGGTVPGFILPESHYE